MTVRIPDEPPGWSGTPGNIQAMARPASQSQLPLSRGGTKNEPSHEGNSLPSRSGTRCEEPIRLVPFPPKRTTGKQYGFASAACHPNGERNIQIADTDYFAL